MKKLLLIAAIVFISSSVLAEKPFEVNDKVLKAFKESFPDVKNVTWNEYADFYQANFERDQVITRIKYDMEGNIISTMRYYGQEHLPPHIVDRLMKRFGNQTVFGVTEETLNGEMNYYITMQDAKNWYVVKSSNTGTLQLQDKFKKAN